MLLIITVNSETQDMWEKKATKCIKKFKFECAYVHIMVNNVLKDKYVFLQKIFLLETWM